MNKALHESNLTSASKLWTESERSGKQQVCAERSICRCKSQKCGTFQPGITVGVVN